MTVGNRIAELRKRRGFTQEYIATQLGVSRQAVSKWEQDISSPDTQNLIGLSKLLNCNVDYLISGSDSISTRTEECNMQRDRRVFIHNTVLTWAAFSLLFGIVLTFIFPYFGPIFIFLAVILMIVASILEK